MDDDFLDVGYFKLAKNISKFSNHRVRVGAVICKNRPISAACNRAKTHPKFADPYKSVRGSIHAEIRAIINCGCEDLKGGTVYVYREHKDGTPGMARPCSSCLDTLEEVGIKKIYYTISEFPYWRTEKI